MVKGIGGSAGYGVGKVVVISDAKPEYVVKNITDTEAEIKRYEDAIIEVYHSFISDKIDDYNSSVYYENPSYIFECFIQNKIL